MAIFVGLDVHRAQITYDALDTETGEVRTGRIRPANRGTVRVFLTGLATRETVVAVEAMTGWRFIAEECVRAGIEVRLAEPAETRMRQDRKRRAKTDKLDARLLLTQERLPESWIAPAHILDLRAKARLRKTLVDQRTEWLQRIHARWVMRLGPIVASAPMVWGLLGVEVCLPGRIRLRTRVGRRGGARHGGRCCNGSLARRRRGHPEAVCSTDTALFRTTASGPRCVRRDCPRDTRSRWLGRWMQRPRRARSNGRGSSHLVDRA
jgi:hypothetical protein